MKYQDIISHKKGKELVLLSALYFVFAAIMVRFGYNIYTAFLLKLNGIQFDFHLLGHTFTSSSSIAWTVEKTLIIFGSGPFLIFLAGILLARYMTRVRNHPWKLRLFLVWLTFVMINYLPFSFFSGAIFFDNFGFAYATLIPNIYIRLIISILIIPIAVFFRPFWIYMFFSASFTKKVFDQERFFKRYIGQVFTKPFMLGFFMLIPFALIHGLWSWIVLMALMSAVVFGCFNVQYPEPPLRIKKSNKIVFKAAGDKYLYFFVLVILLLLEFFL